jgi:hypothetical protein
MGRDLYESVANQFCIQVIGGDFRFHDSFPCCLGLVAASTQNIRILSANVKRSLQLFLKFFQIARGGGDFHPGLS